MARETDLFRVIFYAADDDAGGARVVSDIYEASSIALLYRWARGAQRSALKRDDLPSWCRPTDAKVFRISRYTDRKGRVHRGQERRDDRLSAAFTALYGEAL